ncbi:transposase [Mycolicibacterium boenickei]|nr:transposase [Mycolicibacterium boenickei]
MAKPTKTQYSFEFKLEVVRKVIDEGATAQQVAQEYGLSSASGYIQ